MINRKYNDTDGMCVSKNVNGNECDAMESFRAIDCGTYKCPFYKPIGCKDWVKIENEGGVELYTPEEYKEAWEKRQGIKAKEGNEKLHTSCSNTDTPQEEEYSTQGSTEMQML